MKRIAFFNNKGGVGKTTLVYHVAHALADLGRKVLIADLDPQSNVTAVCLEEERLEELWPDGEEHVGTVLGAVRPMLRGLGDIAPPAPIELRDDLWLLPGDLGLSTFEDELSDAWPRAQDGKESAFRTLSAFYRIVNQTGASVGAELVLLDMGPNLGAINRAALLASDAVVTPVAPDLFSMQGLRNLGPRLREWRQLWAERLAKRPAGIDLPAGTMKPLGYVVMQAGMRLNRPVKAYARFTARIPEEYHRSVLDDGLVQDSADTDPACLGIMRNYQSLMPLAQDARKPMFHLKPADGAIGAHMGSVTLCREDFEHLARQIGERAARLR